MSICSVRVFGAAGRHAHCGALLRGGVLQATFSAHFASSPRRHRAITFHGSVRQNLGTASPTPAHWEGHKPLPLDRLTVECRKWLPYDCPLCDRFCQTATIQYHENAKIAPPKASTVIQSYRCSFSSQIGRIVDQFAGRPIRSGANN